MAQTEDTTVETLRDTIIWEARRRFKEGKYRDMNAAIMSVSNDLDLLLCAVMAENVADKTWRKEETPW